MEEYYLILIENQYTEGVLMGHDFDISKFRNGEMTINEMREYLYNNVWTDEQLRENSIQQDMDGIERCKAQIVEIDGREKAEEPKLSRLIDLKSLPLAHEIDKLLKYEGTIEKQLYRAIYQLERP